MGSALHFPYFNFIPSIILWVPHTPPHHHHPALLLRQQLMICIVGFIAVLIHWIPRRFFPPWFFKSCITLMKKCIFQLFLVQNLGGKKADESLSPPAFCCSFFTKPELPITLVSASCCVYYKWKYGMIQSTQLFNIQYVLFSATCFGSDYWAISRWYNLSDINQCIQLSCLYSVELGPLFIYSRLDLRSVWLVIC
jgi:hypothetical protein